MLKTETVKNTTISDNILRGSSLTDPPPPPTPPAGAISGVAQHHSTTATGSTAVPYKTCLAANSVNHMTDKMLLTTSNNPSSKPKMNLRVDVPHVNPGETVCVVGSSQELGAWNVSNCLPLERDPNPDR